MSHEKKSIGETGEKNRVEPGTLYLVATPIGNRSDLSDRAKNCAPAGASSACICPIGSPICFMPCGRRRSNPSG